ncbi:MAG: hypothetical protein ACQEQU_01835 [Spirochaetota bacterium]
MKKVTVVAVLSLAALVGLISCATGVTTEEFQAYQAEQEREIARIDGEISEIQTHEKIINQLSQEIETLKGSFDSIIASVEELETDTTIDKGKFNELKQHVENLSKEFSKLHEALAELVRYAGYDSADQFLEVAQDIVDVNKNIDRLNERFELLRRAMAIFVEE